MDCCLHAYHGCCARCSAGWRYQAGTAFPAKAGKKDLIDDFSASRLRLNGGYAWSAHSGLGARFADVFGGVVADGTIFTLAVGEGSTSMLAVTPGGKSAPLVEYASNYCDTGAVAAWGKGVIAVGRQGKRAGLGREEPQFVAPHGPAWAVLTKDKNRKLYFYSTAGV